MTRTQPIVVPDHLYCIKEVCELLDIHRNTLRKYTQDEIICCVRITSREIYYSGEEVLLLWKNIKCRQHND
jgi:DNA-binding transcriptional MerR regulator